MGAISPPFIVSVLRSLHTPTAFGCFAQPLFTQFRLCASHLVEVGGLETLSWRSSVRRDGDVRTD